MWKSLRSRYWLSLGFDAIVLVVAMWSIHAWQTRELPIGEAAPLTSLALLQSQNIQSAVQPGQSGIVYFFAPWCAYCRNSIGNLDDLLAGGSVGWVSAIALDYADAGEVLEFVKDTGIDLPVLMGNGQTAQDWGIKGFPTYFVIDAAGNIHSRSVGYSTWLGIRVRSWLAKANISPD
jgi:thiol-disulfide isomerase/thioredoxin